MKKLEKLQKLLFDKQRLMKTEHLLSNNRVIMALVIAVDLLIFVVISYLWNLLHALPKLLVSMGKAEVYIGILPQRITFLGILFYLILFAIVDLMLIFEIKVSWGEESFNVGQKGEARFLETDEVKKEYKAVEPVTLQNYLTDYPGHPGILISRIGKTFYIDDKVVNNLIIGITRSGKGEMLVKTSIELYSRAEEKPSLVINDMKLELYKTFAPILEERGYEVHLLNASNPRFSMGFNLITTALEFFKKKDYGTGELVVKALAYSLFDVEDAKGDMQFFTESASALFSAMVLASIEDALKQDEIENERRYEDWLKKPEEVRKKQPFRYLYENEKTVNMYSMILNFGEMVRRPINKSGSRTELDAFFETRPKLDRARLKYLGVEIAPGKTKSSVFSEMLRQIDIFTLTDVARMTTESTLDLKKIGFGEKPIAIFMAVPSYDRSLYKLPIIFLRQMYYVLGKECDDKKGKCDRQVKVVFDEAGNMPEIELMDTMTTVGLGQNISFDLYVQNYEQLDDLYGEKMSETIKGNCGNHFFLQTKSDKTAEAFSKLLGNKSFIDIQRAGGKLSWHKYFTESIQEWPLLDQNRLMELMEGEIVIHRTSKRRDLSGQKIKPHPIFNSVENDRYLWYAYQFFPAEIFKNPNEVNFLDICKESSRAHINPEEYVWDYEKSFELIEMRKWKLRELADIDYPMFCSLLAKSIGEHALEDYGITPERTISEMMGLVNTFPIPEAEKDTLRAVLTAGERRRC